LIEEESAMTAMSSATQISLPPGLNAQEAKALLAKYGPNEIYKPERISFLGIAREELGERMIQLLIVTGILYSILGELRDAITIFLVIGTLLMAEVWTEYRAQTAIGALAKLSAVKTRVRRSNQIIEIDTLEVVPGDLLALSQGTKINADATVQDTIGLQADESALTGESFPVEKKGGDPLFAGTFIVSGEGQAVVTVTGAQTRLGKIAAQTKEMKVPQTALQLAMKSLAGKLVYVAVAFAILIPVLGILRGQDWHLMLLTGLALAFAVIPEELPIVITMVLGLGSYKLSKGGFLVKQLRTAEALGNATVIVTDKTGTITEGRMKAVATFPADPVPVLRAALACASDLAVTPVDDVIRERAKELGLPQDAQTLLRERDRSDAKKTRAAVRNDGNDYTLYKSGAPEEVFSACRAVAAEATAELEKQTRNGRRVIAVATRSLTKGESQKPFDQLETGMTFCGLIALEDSPRPGVKETIARAARAGIRTIMVTGDHPLTAAYIANQVGISSAKVLSGEEIDRLSDEALRQAVRDVSVFARSTPEHKYRIVKSLQDNHEVVAVTGDGINDVLALKGADIGIAMGVKGTDVAREAASVVLADDNFNTIATGIFEGRGFFDNLSKGVRYYLAVKTALVLIFLLPVLVGIPMPFAPIQIIVLEIFMDLAASAGFTAEPKEKSIYTRKPRDPQLNVFNNRAILDVLIKACVLFVAVTCVYLYAYAHTSSLVEAQTFAFAAWIIGHVTLAFISRSDRALVVSTGIFSNGIMTVWALLAVAVLLLGIYTPYVAGRLKLAVVSPIGLLAVFGVVIVILLTLEARKLFGGGAGITDTTD
jgi:Ca2+-transporting ATPase